MNKSEANLFSPMKSTRNNKICENYFKSRSSSQSGEIKSMKRNSESSISSNNSVLHMKKNSSIDGLHNFNMKTLNYMNRDISDCSFETYSNGSVQSRRSNSSTAMYVEEKVKLDETKNYNLPMLQEVNKII